MNGIINVLKPPGMTSFDVVAYLRGRLKIKKIGHTGTLDPNAIGVLTICVGKATRIIEFLTDKDKTYRTQIKFGIKTNTQDISGEVTGNNDINIDFDKYERVVKSFIGVYNQIPPMFSAKKIDGNKLYNLAQQGIEIERKPVKVKIHDINVLSFNNEEKTSVIDVKCSKGTYIRTLCNDIGERLESVATMAYLIRTQSGNFKIEDALTLEEINDLIKNNKIQDSILKIHEALTDFHSLELDEKNVKKFTNGISIKYINDNLQEIKYFKIFDMNKNFVGIGVLVVKDNSSFIKPYKIFV